MHVPHKRDSRGTAGEREPLPRASHPLLAVPCRDNVEDALTKLQEILDAAWKAVQPIEEDPEKKKKLEKQKKKGTETRLLEKKFKSDKKKDRRSKIDY
jgi:hypothetical protein